MITLYTKRCRKLPELLHHADPEFGYVPERIVKLPVCRLRFDIIEQGIAEIPVAVRRSP
jgi:hypothetical protein